MVIEVPVSRLVAVNCPPSSKYRGRPLSVVLAFRDVPEKVGVGLIIKLGAVGNEEAGLSSPAVPGLLALRRFSHTDVFGPVSAHRAASLYVWNDSPIPVHTSAITTRAVWDGTKSWGEPPKNHHHLIVLLSSMLEFPYPMAMAHPFLAATDAIRARFDGSDDGAWYDMTMAAGQARTAHLPSFASIIPGPGRPTTLEYLDPVLLAHAITSMPNGTVYRNSPPSFTLPPP